MAPWKPLFGASDSKNSQTTDMGKITDSTTWILPQTPHLTLFSNLLS